MLLVRTILVLLPLLASACASMAGMAAAPAAAIGTTAASGKTPVDHVVSLISGKDCSIRRNLQGLTYCVEDEHVPPVRVVCYRTLGDVSCYDRRDPFHGRERAIVEDLGVTLSPSPVGDPIPPGMLPGPLQQTPPSDAVEYESERFESPQTPSSADGMAEAADGAAPL